MRARCDGDPAAQLADFAYLSVGIYGFFYAHWRETAVAYCLRSEQRRPPVPIQKRAKIWALGCGREAARTRDHATCLFLYPIPLVQIILYTAKTIEYTV